MNKNKFVSTLKNIGLKIISIFKTVFTWIGRSFFGAGKTYAYEVEKRRKEANIVIEKEKINNEKRLKKAKKKNGDIQSLNNTEEIVSPFKQIVRNFFSRKLAVVALCVVIFMFLFVFIGPLFMTDYSDEYTSYDQKSLEPNLTMKSVPSALNGNIKSISSNGNYTIGLSNDGKIYYWGVTTLGTTKLDIEECTPEAVKNTEIAMVSAGYDHAVAIAKDGTVYAWGSNDLGQFISTENDYNLQKDNNRILMMPESLRYNGTIDVENVKKLVCGTQFTAILMNDGTSYCWGNLNAVSNAETFSKSTPLLYDIALTKTSILGITLNQKEIYAGNSTQFSKVKSSINSSSIDYSLLIGKQIIKFISVSSTNSNVCFLVENKAGKNSIWYAGNFSDSYSSNPTLNTDEYFVNLTGGANHYIGLTNKGNVYTWGDNTHKQSSISNYNAGNVENVSIFAGSYQTYILNNGKVVKKCGLSGYIFGTDKNGASIFKRLVSGGKMTLTIGAVAVIISSIIGIIVGCISGYFGGWVDMFLMRVTEIVSAIPFLPFAMILSCLMGTMNISEDQRILIIMIILGVLSWPGLAHLVRGQVLQARENEYITAAKAMGVSEFKIAFKHILPNVISVIIVSLTLDFAGCMLTESSLSYLGFGVTYPRPTWGNMLNATTNLTTIGNFWWMWLFPAIFLAITTICINIVGDTLRDVMDPKSTLDK